MARTKTDTVAHWGCDKCSQKWTTYLPMYTAPTHHCPSPKARKVRNYILLDGYPLEKRPPKVDKSKDGR
jgi:hypothetical protein